mgnify:CR=1 FL=1|jgi:hypothetical protein
MNQKILLILPIFILFVIPIANAQLMVGEEANQKLIEVKVDKSEILQIKHIVASSNVPVTLNLFEGEISNLKILNEKRENVLENGKQAGILSDAKGNQSVLIFPSKQNSIVEYNLEDKNTMYDNLWTSRIQYDEKFSILVSEDIDSIFVNNNLIQLEDKKGISINGGGKIILQYYNDIPKIVKQIQWEENSFDVEIISNSKINNFNFEQESKSIHFEINEKNKFVTITMSEELLGGPYVILLEDEKIKYAKSFPDENHVSLTMKPESTGQITIIGTTVIPEFSMFIPLIMGFLVVLTVPLMRRFSLH